MYDLGGYYNRPYWYPYYNGSTLNFVERVIPSEGTTLYDYEIQAGLNKWRTYSDHLTPPSYYAYLSEEPVNGLDYSGAGLGTPQSGKRLFVTNIDPSVDPTVTTSAYPTFFRMVTTKSFARPRVNGQSPLIISGWVRLNSTDPAETNHGAKLVFCHEDNNAMYYAYILSTTSDTSGTPNASRIGIEDRTGDSSVGGFQTLATSTTFTTWTKGVKYRFDVVVDIQTIKIFIGGSEVVSVNDSRLRTGNIGWRLDKCHVDFGDMVVTGEGI